MRPKFEKRHYFVLAYALKNGKPHAIDKSKLNPAELVAYISALKQWARMCNYIGDALLIDNYKFDRLKFLKACGYYEQDE